MRARTWTLVSVGALMALSVGCGGAGETGSGASGGGGSGANHTGGTHTGGTDTGGTNTGGGTGGVGGAQGSLIVHVQADQAAATDAVVSLGVPFERGTFADPALLLLRDDAGTEVPLFTESLATWPTDGSQRSVLVAFHASLGAGEETTFTLEYGNPRTQNEDPLAPNPDGPAAAWVDPAWYASTRGIGANVPVDQNTAFPGWESQIEDYLANMDPPWESYGLSCATTSAERAYYDGPHALYQRFTHRGGASAYRRARLEAVWYRDNELNWFDNDEVAVYACVDSWDPTVPLDWGVVRRMLGQAMLDDYLLTGDPQALAALRGLGEAFRRNLTALTTGDEITVKVTERNMAWPMMGLASYYAVEQTAEVKSALQTLVDMTVAWQAEGESGAFEHDINRPDPDECGDGPSGGSPFMTSLLIDGLMDSWILTGDKTIPPVIVKAAEWYRDDAITSDGVAFQYLWGCTDVDYDDSSTADLNLLISHVFGAAYVASDDQAWLTFGDTMANHGIDNMYAGAPKQWSQSSRTFMKYMGYRAEALTP